MIFVRSVLRLNGLVGGEMWGRHLILAFGVFWENGFGVFINCRQCIWLNARYHKARFKFGCGKLRCARITLSAVLCRVAQAYQLFGLLLLIYSL